MTTTDDARSTASRSKGTGSIYLRPDDPNVADLRITHEGRRIKRTVRRRPADDRKPTERTRDFHKRLERELRELNADAAAGRLTTRTAKPSSTSSPTFGERAERYLRFSTARPTTIDGYRELLHAYVLPHIGNVTLHEFTPEHLIAMNDALAQRIARGGNPLSHSTRHSVARLTRAILAAADLECLLTDEARMIPGAPEDEDQRTKDRIDARALGSEELRALLTVGLEGERLAPLVRFLALTGCRRSEALGLAWNEVDLDNSTVTIRRALVPTEGGAMRLGPTKTKAKGSTRSIRVPEPVVTDLRKRKFEALEDEVAAAGWVSTMADHDGKHVDLVFRDEVGRALTVGVVRAVLHRATHRAGLARRRDEHKDHDISAHDLRHTMISHMVAEGVPNTTIASYVGHTDISMIVNRYAHSLREHDDIPADTMSAIVGL